MSDAEFMDMIARKMDERNEDKDATIAALREEVEALNNELTLKRFAHEGEEKALRSRLAEAEGKVEELTKKYVRVYPCADCGKLRTADEGGTTFTVCDECWDKHFDGKHNR